MVYRGAVGTAERARGVLLALLAAEASVLVVTGVVLFFIYRPSAAEPWADIAAGSRAATATLSSGMRAAHRIVSGLAVLTAVAAGFAGFAAALAGGVSRLRACVVGGAQVLVVAAASATGFLLPWDQLALWAVTVGTDLRGYRVLFNDAHVRFVIIGGTEISRSTLLRWLVIHIALGAVVVPGLIALNWRRSSPSPPSSST